MVFAVSLRQACEYVIEIFEQVYKNEKQTQTEKMDDETRLRFHLRYSAPLMKELKAWMEQHIEAREVEPNSGLGEAINYMLKRWGRLTRFLHLPGVPLDNNLCERGLKMAIRHRNNSLFYKTENGARVGDMFMSLIHTCRLCRANPFDDLTKLRRFAKHLREDPSRWMPWNYQATIAAIVGD